MYKQLPEWFYSKTVPEKDIMYNQIKRIKYYEH